jgi:5-oxoprolinase (ATP-hydrolysing)
MKAIQDSAELATRNLFKNIAKSFNSTQVSAVDYMDDGTPIQLQVSINEEDGSATFDFTGTGPEVYGTYTLHYSRRSLPQRAFS